jgi:hypothetical protein
MQAIEGGARGETVAVADVWALGRRWMTRADARPFRGNANIAQILYHVYDIEDMFMTSKIGRSLCVGLLGQAFSGLNLFRNRFETTAMQIRHAAGDILSHQHVMWPESRRT